MMRMLTASQRVKLISAIANEMSNEEWPMIDLALKQFKLPWMDSWSGSKLGYLLEMLNEASDNTLISLGSHLEIEPFARSSSIEPSFWRSGQFRLFLSHIEKFKVEATELQQHLSNFHISAFVAHRDIEPTKE